VYSGRFDMEGLPFIVPKTRGDGIVPLLDLSFFYILTQAFNLIRLNRPDVESLKGAAPLSGPIEQVILIFAVFPVVGLSLIVFAIVRQKHMIGRQVINLTYSRLGIGLKADAFALVVLIGCAMCGASVFLILQGYDIKLKALEGQVGTLQNQMQGMNETVQETISAIKDYNLDLWLIPAPTDPPPASGGGAQSIPIDAKINAFVQRKGASQAELYNDFQVKKGPGGLTVHFDKLRLGDILRVTATSGSSRWQSDYLEMPSAIVTMHLVPANQ
jgi:hypothetical protein